MDDRASLATLRGHFLATSTQSMPIAGMLYWTVVAVAGMIVAPVVLSYIVLFGSGMVFPVAALIDRLRGRRVTAAGTDNPVIVLFLRSLVIAVLLWPLVIIAARAAGEPDIIVLGGAILMGIIWAPYGWAADDPSGFQHAVARTIGCYLAYLSVPQPYRASAVAVVVLACYLFSLVRMRRPDPVSAGAAVSG